MSNSLPPGCEFGQADMQKLVPKEEKPSGSTAVTTAFGSRRTGNINHLILLLENYVPETNLSKTSVTATLS